MEIMRRKIDAHKEEEARNSASESEESEQEPEEDEVDEFEERRAAIEARRKMLAEAEENLKKIME